MKRIYDMRMMTKLVLGFGLMLALLAAVAGLGLSSARDANASLAELYEHDIGASTHVYDLRLTLRAMRGTALDVLARPRGSDRASHVQEFGRLEQEANRLFDEAAEHLQRDREREQLKDARTAYADWVRTTRSAVDVSAKDLDKALELDEKADELGKRMDEPLDRLSDGVEAMAKTVYEAGLAQQHRDRLLIVLLLAVAVLAIVGFGFVVRSSVVAPIETSVSVLERVAEGDLTARLEFEREDEIGRLAAALNRSVESIRETMVRVRDVADEVASASTELSSAAEQISGGAQEQASSLEETAASLEEISSTVKQNADNARHASQLASGARDAAERGGQVVEAAVSAMAEITKSSAHISDIITTIDEIAFQTNLLALNAAVEAARAGEQGRGFGVVAAEVRNLAQRTASAAKEIRGLIVDSSNKVEAGTDRVNQSGETLHEIVRAVKRVTDMVAEIAAASSEQSTGLGQVNTAVSQVDQVTQSNASQTEELSATAESLATKATDLRSLVSSFKVGGSERRAAPFAPSRATPAASRSARQPRKQREPHGDDVMHPAHAAGLLSLSPPPPSGSNGQNGSQGGFEEF